MLTTVRPEVNSLESKKNRKPVLLQFMNWTIQIRPWNQNNSVGEIQTTKNMEELKMDPTMGPIKPKVCHIKLINLEEP